MPAHCPRQHVASRAFAEVDHHAGLWWDVTEFAGGGVGRGARIVPPAGLVSHTWGRCTGCAASSPNATCQGPSSRIHRLCSTAVGSGSRYRSAWLAGSPSIMMITVAW